MTARVANICPQCLSIEWVDREGLVLNALKGSRRFKMCDECIEMQR